MPSSITFATPSSTKNSTSSIYKAKKPQKMLSLTQTYFLAHSSRQKLSKEAARPDHDLRLLVGHANMLDALMIDLANAEQEQERWFHRSVSGAKQSEEDEPSEEWAETIVEEPEEDWHAEDAEDNESEEDEEEEKLAIVTTAEMDSDDDDNLEDLALTRTHSRHSPPGLSHDSDSDSEDEQMPPSPPQPTVSMLTEKQRQAIATTSFYDAKDTSLSPTEQETFEEDGFFLPSRQQSTIIAAY